MKNTSLVIGAGGIASYFMPLATRALDTQFVLVDGDTLEERNLDRQQFADTHIGENKAQALADMYPRKIKSVIPRYFTDEYELDTETDIDSISHIVVCADNNTPRQKAVALGSRLNAPVIILANETRSWDAMLWHPSWPNLLNPLRVFPEWDTEDNLNPAQTCTSEEAIQESEGQLPLANASAALFGVQLISIWTEFPSGSAMLTECPNRPFYYHGNGVHTTYQSVKNIHK